MTSREITLEPPRNPRPLEKALAIQLGALILGSALAIGSVHWWSLAPVTLLAAVTMWVAVRVGAKPRWAIGWAAPAAVLGALALYTLLQALPLPAGLLATVAPANADVHAHALDPLALAAPARASISLDPGASLVEAAKWLTYAAVLVASATLASRWGAGWVVRLVFLSALTVALVTVAHGVAGTSKIYGLYVASFEVPAWHAGPLLNPNNLAGYLNLGVMCGLGVALGTPERPSPWAWIGIACVIGVGVLSASRGGVLALPIGLVALAILLLVRRRYGAGKAAWGLVAGATVGGALLAVLAGTQTVWSELYDRNVAKLGIALDTVALIRDYPWLGIGRGAFESVFQAYRLPGSNVYTHAENWPAQWLSEWGVPVSCVALAALAWLLRPSRVGVRTSATHAAAFLGLCLLGLQNLVDLALEIPGVTIAAVATAGALLGDQARRDGSAARRAAQRWCARLSYAGAAALAALAAGVVFAGRHEVASERRDVHAAFLATDLRDEAARGALRSALRDAMRRHPAEPYFPYVGALVAWHSGVESPMPWLQRTLERALTHADAHLLLADVLATLKAYGQARFEVRLALENDQFRGEAAAARLVRWSRSFAELLEGVPPGVPGVPTLEAAAALLAPKDAERRRACDRETLARAPLRLAPRWRLGEDVLAELAAPSERCSAEGRAACEAELAEHLEALERSAPRTSEATRMRARKLVADGKLDEAERMLGERCASHVDRGACLRERAELAARLPDPARLEIAARELDRASCTVRAHCADARTFVGELYGRRDEWNAALAQYLRAARDDPRETRWLAVARVATRAGAHAQAVDALEHVTARRKPGSDPELDRWLEEQRSELTRAILNRR
jgi:tetratricopeptide (TPR) repeat protein